jgi:hypothetical protein
VLLEQHCAAARAGGIGVDVEGFGDVWYEGGAIVFLNVRLQVTVLLYQVRSPSESGFLPFVLTVGSGNEIVEGEEVLLNVRKMWGNEVDLANEGAQGGDGSWQWLVYDGFNVCWGVGDEAMGYRVPEKGSFSGGKRALVRGEVDIVTLAGTEYGFDVLEVGCKIGRVDEQVIEVDVGV